MLQSEVYYQRSVFDTTTNRALPTNSITTENIGEIQSIFDTSLTNPNTVIPTDTTRIDTFIKSEYAPAFGLKIEKRYRNSISPTIRAGDMIEVDISMTNTTNIAIQDIEYLDTLPSIFDAEGTETYRVTLGAESQERAFEWLATEEYDMHFRGRSIPA